MTVTDKSTVGWVFGICVSEYRVGGDDTRVTGKWIISGKIFDNIATN